MEIDFVIEVYRLPGNYPFQQWSYLFRFIPVGTTYNKFSKEPDYVFHGRMKPRYRLGLDSPVLSCVMHFSPK